VNDRKKKPQIHQLYRLDFPSPLRIVSPEPPPPSKCHPLLISTPLFQTLNVHLDSDTSLYALSGRSLEQSQTVRVLDAQPGFVRAVFFQSCHTVTTGSQPGVDDGVASPHLDVYSALPRLVEIHSMALERSAKRKCEMARFLLW
jgi:hypothetical protein